MDMVERSQWFYGVLYGVFYDPLEGKHRNMIAGYIPEGSTVLDVCCGTGRLALELASKCRSVTGVDLSGRMLAFSNSLKKRQETPNVEFLHGDATRLEEVVDRSYDYAVISLALHEMPAAERIKTLQSMAKIARHLVIADHAVPQPKSIPGYMTTLAELCFGGRSNFAIYNEFVASGGILGALDKSGITLEHQAMDDKGIRHVVKASGL